jgi:hypothetical protein
MAATEVASPVVAVDVAGSMALALAARADVVTSTDRTVAEVAHLAVVAARRPPMRDLFRASASAAERCGRSKPSRMTCISGGDDVDESPPVIRAPQSAQ